MEDNRRPVDITRKENIIDVPARRNVLDALPVPFLRSNDTTPSVINVEHLIARNTTPVSIDYFDDGQPGQCIYILGDGQTTVNHDPLKISVAGSASHLLANKILYVFVNFAGVWYEQCCDVGGGPEAHAATHQNGGTDELNVTGLSGLLADPQTPSAHNHTLVNIVGDAAATRKFVRSLSSAVAWDTLVAGDIPAHNHGAGDITSGILPVLRGGTGLSAVGTANQVLATDPTGTFIEWQTLSGGGPYVPHAAAHQNGGVDEIDVTNLSGLLADPQTPLAHFHAGADINSGTINIARIPTGTTGTTVPFGNDARFSDARAPTAHNHNVTDLVGDVAATRKFIRSVSNVVAWDTLVSGDIPAHNHSGGNITSGTVANTYLPAASTTAAGIVQLATSIEITAGLAVQASDSRLTDSRTPNPHQLSHNNLGTDALKLDDLATPDDNTDLNASTTRHGLLKKLSNIATEYMNGQGNWSTPPSGPPVATNAVTGTVRLNTTYGSPGTPSDPTVYPVEGISTLMNTKVEIGGHLANTVVVPRVIGMRESAGPTDLLFGAIADGQFLQRSGTNVIGATAATAKKYVRKTANQVVSTVAYASVTDLVFAVLANTVYAAEFDIAFQSAAATTGVGFSVTVPAAETSLSITQQIIGVLLAATAGAVGSGLATADDTGVFTGAVNTINTTYIARVKVLLVNGANAGNLQLRCRSEVAASNITLMAGSFGTMDVAVP